MNSRVGWRLSNSEQLVGWRLSNSEHWEGRGLATVGGGGCGGLCNSELGGEWGLRYSE